MNRWLLMLMGMMLLLPAWMLWQSSKQQRVQEKTRKNLEQALPFFDKTQSMMPGKQDSWLKRQQLRLSVQLGFELAMWQIVAIAMLLLIMHIILDQYFIFWQAGGMTLGLALVLLFFVPYVRLRRRQRQIVMQIPMFIDQMARALSTGKSVEGAVRGVAADIQMPLREVLDRVIRSTDLGVSFAEAIHQAAQLHGIKELGLIALAIRISSNYGSSPQELLKSVVHMIRQQEQAQRELAAMTGETKITAWVLSLTPLLILGYMYVSNPGYLDMMLQDASGAMIFKGALIMQVTGVLIFWRMMKSI